MKYVSDEQAARVAALRRAIMARQPERRCWKHPEAPSRLFMVAQPGRKTKRLWLCVECAAVLVDWHGATLKGVKA